MTTTITARTFGARSWFEVEARDAAGKVRSLTTTDTAERAEEIAAEMKARG